jgi:hypothetical protein
VADGATGTTLAASIPTGDHARHDLLLVAEAADRGGRLPAAQAACPDCQALHAELVSLAAALPMAALPARPRDYTLSPADAERLRPAGWRRFVGAIGTSRDVVTRPLAIGLTTLGLAGLLVATIPGALTGSLGSAGAAPTTTNAPAAANEAAGPAATGAPSAAATAAPAPAIGAPAAAAPAPSGAAPSQMQLEIASEAPKTQADQSGTDTARASATSQPDDLFFGGDDEAAATDTTTAAGAGPQQTNAPAAGVLADREDAGVASVLFVLAGLMLVVGLGLFTLRWIARRA